MKTPSEISNVLSREADTRRYGKMQLAADAGVTYRTLSHVLGGERDFKVSTLLAVADRLGLELVLVPTEARLVFPSRVRRHEPSDMAPFDAKGLSASDRSGYGEDDLPSGIVSKVQARLARARKGLA